MEDIKRVYLEYLRIRKTDNLEQITSLRQELAILLMGLS